LKLELAWLSSKNQSVRTRSLAWVGAALLLLPAICHARRIGYIPRPEQLSSQAALICTGKVISMAYTGSNLMSVYDGGVAQGYPETWMSARVKVLHVFKGSAPAEIVIRYRVPRPNGLLCDSPIHMRLATGDRYRFFLGSASEQGEFVECSTAGSTMALASRLFSRMRPLTIPS